MWWLTLLCRTYQVTNMRLYRHRGCYQIKLNLIGTATVRRHYATKYTANITSTSPTGRSLSAEVKPPPPLPTDTRGYALPRRELICKVTHIILHQSSSTKSDDAFYELSDYLTSLSISLTPFEASEILKSLNNPQLALQFFRFCSSLSPDFRHDSCTYTRLLLILSKSMSPKRLDLVRSILSELEECLKMRGNISMINILIGLFGHSEDLERCLGLLKKWDLKMNSYTYKCLLQAYLRSYDSSKAFDTYSEMRRRGYKLDIFSYNMLLDALGKNEKV